MSILKQILQEMAEAIQHSPTTGEYWSNLRWSKTRSGVGMPELSLFGGPEGDTTGHAYRAVFIKYSDGIDPSLEFSRTGVHNPDRNSSTVRFGTNSKQFAAPTDINPYLKSIGLPELSVSELQYLTDDPDRVHVPVNYEHSTRGTMVAFPTSFFNTIRADSADVRTFVSAANRAMKRHLDFIPQRPSTTTTAALETLFNV